MLALTHNLDDENEARRYYVRNEVVPFEEDLHHEFKGHRNLCVEEIPPWCMMPNYNAQDKPTRQPVSKAINGFLNSGEGGTVYLGIVDNGTVKGMTLTQYQMDHVNESLKDLMSRYTPPVEPHRYRVRIVPIVEKNSSQEEVERCLNHDSSELIDRNQQKKEHILRTNRYCWCTKEAIARANVGKIAAEYVIEIIILPWDPSCHDNQYGVGKMKAPPVHEDECNQVYIRRHGGVMNHTPQEVYEMGRQRAQIHYQKRLQLLRDELARLREKSSERTHKQHSS